MCQIMGKVLEYDTTLIEETSNYGIFWEKVRRSIAEMPSMDEGQRDEHSTENEESGEWAGLCRRHLVTLETMSFHFHAKCWAG